MKYYRLMSPNELEKFLDGEVLDRQGRKKWFSEESYFYFFGDEEGGFKTLEREFFSFFEFDDTYVVVEFESNILLQKQFVKEYNTHESVCKKYSSAVLTAKRFCPVRADGLIGTWRPIKQYYKGCLSKRDRLELRREREIQRRNDRQRRGKT